MYRRLPFDPADNQMFVLRMDRRMLRELTYRVLIGTPPSLPTQRALEEALLQLHISDVRTATELAKGPEVN